jgi:cysteine desulfurase
MSEAVGNASSIHVFGQKASAAVDRARRQVKTLIGGSSGDLIFTGSGTEAVFLAMVGVARPTRERGCHIVVSAVEHPAGIDAANHLLDRGWEVTWLSPDSSGRVTPESVSEAVRDDTVLVSVMHANNETGVIQPVEAIARICRSRGVSYHVDAVQSLGKIPVNAEGWDVDLLSIAAHKFGGPPGVGALWIRSDLELAPVIPGTQERGLRGGTHNLPGIVGFGAAAEVAGQELAGQANALEALRGRLEAGMGEAVPEATLTAAGSDRLPNTSHYTFDPGLGQDLVLALDVDGFAVSSGSACKSGSVNPSHVLLAMRLSPDRARTAIRVSLGHGNTPADVDRFVAAVAGLVNAGQRVRS